MTQQKFCQDCNQRQDCQKIYQQLAGAKVSSVVPQVTIAFLLPLLVFISALAASGQILGQAIAEKELHTALSLLVALVVTSIFILVIIKTNRRSGENR